MFEKIYDDVYLVVKYDASTFSIYQSSVNGSWLYRQFVSFVLYITEKINSFSQEHRQIMTTLNTEKKLLMVVNIQIFTLLHYALIYSTKLVPT